MFCGLGNFTLPLARSGARVVGVEGSAPLIARAKENAVLNGLAEQIEYHVANLFEVTPEKLAGWGCFDKMLIDPPREGAIELVKSFGEDAPAYRVCVVQPGNTGARCGRAGARKGLSAGRCGDCQHVPAHFARRVDRAV